MKVATVKWTQKALVQNLIAKLPSHLSYAIYYLLQRTFGGLRNTTPIGRLTAGIKIANYISSHEYPLESKVFLEIGTGHQLNLPLALWLCGASEVITVDLNPYLKEDLALKDISFIRAHHVEIIKLFEGLHLNRLFAERLKRF